MKPLTYRTQVGLLLATTLTVGSVCGVSFVGVVLLLYFLITRTKKGLNFFEKWMPHAESGPKTQNPVGQPEIAMAVVVHGTFRGLDELVEALSPFLVTDLINEYFNIITQAVLQYGGVLTSVGGKSFVATWGGSKSNGNDVWCAVRCTLAIRESIFNLNHSKKVDSGSSLNVSMGIHCGEALIAWLGSGDLIRYVVAGKVVNCSTSLDFLAYKKGLDLLISRDVWNNSDAKFVGEQLGEAKLTEMTDPIHFFSISGYRNEEGLDVVVSSFESEVNSDSTISTSSPDSLSNLVSHSETDLNPDFKTEIRLDDFLIQENSERRWLVNNGTQTVGPFTAREIASRLFSQELDFDCECIEQGSGVATKIKEAGIFTGSQDSGANFWFYDGELVHGPVTPGFMKTALNHGAIPASAYVCEESTVLGWKPLENCEPSWFPSHQEEPLMDAPLRDSLVPPPPASVEEVNEAENDPKLNLEGVEQDPSKKAA